MVNVIDLATMSVTAEFNLSIHNVRQVKACGEFIGMLPSAKICSFYNPELCFSIEMDHTQSDAILGFEWSFANELVVICTDGLHFYKIIGSIFHKVNFLACRISWYKYCLDSKLLLLSISNARLKAYRLKWESKCSFVCNIETTSHRTTFSQFLQSQISIANIYGSVYVLYFGPKTLYLYKIHRKSSTIDFVLPLEKGDFSFNIVDNLLVIHNSTIQRSFIYDLKSNDPLIPIVDPCHGLFKSLHSVETSTAKPQSQLVSPILPTQEIESSMISSMPRDSPPRRRSKTAPKASQNSISSWDHQQNSMEDKPITISLGRNKSLKKTMSSPRSKSFDSISDTKVLHWKARAMNYIILPFSGKLCRLSLDMDAILSEFMANGKCKLEVMNFLLQRQRMLFPRISSLLQASILQKIGINKIHEMLNILAKDSSERTMPYEFRDDSNLDFDDGLLHRSKSNQNLRRGSTKSSQNMRRGSIVSTQSLRIPENSLSYSYQHSILKVFIILKGTVPHSYLTSNDAFHRFFGIL